jgi:hypothetical protein
MLLPSTTRFANRTISITFKTSRLGFSRSLANMAGQSSNSSLLLTARQVQELPPESTKFFDATWFMPNSPRNARSEFAKLRIPGAQYLDLDEVASPNELGLKHMMPSPQQFKEACGKSQTSSPHGDKLS